MNRLIIPIYRRMLAATVLVIVACILSAILYFHDKDKQPEANCATLGPAFSYKNDAAWQTIFNQNCASCHHHIRDGVGPALKGLDQRFPIELLPLYLSNPDEAVKKSPYLQQLRKQYGNIGKPAFNLTEKEIEALIRAFSSDVVPN